MSWYNNEDNPEEIFKVLEQLGEGYVRLQMPDACRCIINRVTLDHMVLSIKRFIARRPKLWPSKLFRLSMKAQSCMSSRKKSPYWRNAPVHTLSNTMEVISTMGKCGYASSHQLEFHSTNPDRSPWNFVMLDQPRISWTRPEKDYSRLK